MMQPGMPQSHPGMSMPQGMQGMNPAMMQNMQQMQQMQNMQNMQSMGGMGNPMTPVRGGQQQQQQGQPDPNNHYLRASQLLPLTQPLTYELAVQYLLKSLSIAQTTPFFWLPIDKPGENDLYLVYHSNAPNVPWAVDGLRYMDQNETSFKVNIQGHELEVREHKFAFIPGVGETQATRVKRKFRLLKGGNPNLWLIYYTRGQGQPVPPIFQSPQRKYPIPTCPPNPILVLQNRPTHPGQPPLPNQTGIPGRSPQKDMQRALLLAQQQQQQQQQAQQQQHHAQQRQMQQQQQLKLEDDSDDEPEFLTKRDLAKARFMRNSEFMQEIFAYPGPLADLAADPWATQTPQSLEAQLLKLESDIRSASSANQARTEMLKKARRDPEQEQEAEADMAREGMRGEGGDEPDVPVLAVLPVSAPGGGATSGVQTPLAGGEKAAGTPAAGAAAGDTAAEGDGEAEGEEVDMDADADADDAEDADADEDEDAAAEKEGEEHAEADDDAEAAGEEEEGKDEDMDGDAEPAESALPAEAVNAEVVMEEREELPIQPDQADEEELAAEIPGTVAEERAEAALSTPAEAAISTPADALPTEVDAQPAEGPAAVEGETLDGTVPERAEEDPHEVKEGPLMEGGEMPPAEEGEKAEGA